MVRKPVKKAVKTPEIQEKEEVMVEKNEISESETEKEVEMVAEQMEKKDEVRIIGNVKRPVIQKSAFIKTKSYSTPVPMYEIPEDIRGYLLNKWFGTNVYEKGREWLEAHNADMEMIEKLKKFISEHYL